MVLHWDCNPARDTTLQGFSISADSSNLCITNLVSPPSLSVNSLHIDVNMLACATDNETVVLVDTEALRLQ